MDDLVEKISIFQGKKVLVTGDTGFKGSWLCLWLNLLGADVYGYAFPPKNSDDHFNVLGLINSIHHRDGDIRDFEKMKTYFQEVEPEFVFHLAAQALVRPSYIDPKETFDTNVGGSVNLLECVRNTSSIKSVIYVTSDKCYKNNEWIWGYRETDELGGYDPYSASKGAAEIVVSAYQNSFFKEMESLGVASVRAGNVIGGGDWSLDRIVPDCIKALSKGLPIEIRKPNATRPWQYVLEPLSGYLLLASRLYFEPKKFSGAWNFGPKTESSRTVHELTKKMIQEWGSGSIELKTSNSDPHEAGLLHLNCDKSELLLKWKPRWNFDRTVKETISWYRAVTENKNALEISKSQILSYQETKND